MKIYAATKERKLKELISFKNRKELKEWIGVTWNLVNYSSFNLMKNVKTDKLNKIYLMDNDTGDKSTLSSAISIIKGKVQEYENRPFHLQRNWVFATNCDFLIPISLYPNLVDLSMLSVGSNNLSLSYERFTTLGCKDKRVGNLSFWQTLNSFDLV